MDNFLAGRIKLLRYLSSYVCKDVVFRLNKNNLVEEEKGKEKRLRPVIGCRKPFSMLIPLPFA
jgi:hypothetical protein